jgi:hypothetical protein
LSPLPWQVVQLKTPPGLLWQLVQDVAFGANERTARRGSVGSGEPGVAASERPAWHWPHAPGSSGSVLTAYFASSIGCQLRARRNFEWWLLERGSTKPGGCTVLRHAGAPASSQRVIAVRSPSLRRLTIGSPSLCERLSIACLIGVSPSLARGSVAALPSEPTQPITSMYVLARQPPAGASPA